MILDVVYNHTAEGNEMGPTLSFRGLDNASYYRLAPNPRHYINDTGTGNTLNMDHPFVVRMVMDSLRYWVETFRVDGFRFDLASTLGRTHRGFDRDGPFLQAVRQDPVLSPREAHRRALGRRARAATSSAPSRPPSSNGTTSSATRCAASGAATAT